MQKLKKASYIIFIEGIRKKGIKDFCPRFLIVRKMFFFRQCGGSSSLTCFLTFFNTDSKGVFSLYVNHIFYTFYPEWQKLVK